MGGGDCVSVAHWEPFSLRKGKEESGRNKTIRIRILIPPGGDFWAFPMRESLKFILILKQSYKSK